MDAGRGRRERSDVRAGEKAVTHGNSAVRAAKVEAENELKDARCSAARDRIAVVVPDVPL
jgi:hypothetical protein